MTAQQIKEWDGDEVLGSRYTSFSIFPIFLFLSHL